MEIVDTTGSPLIDYSSRTIPIGTVFSGSMGGASGINSIFLRTYDEIVDLRDPNKTLECITSKFTVTNFKFLKATLTVSNP